MSTQSERQYIEGRIGLSEGLRNGDQGIMGARLKLAQNRQRDLVEIKGNMTFVQGRVLEGLKAEPGWDESEVEAFKQALAADPSAARQSLEGKVSETFNGSEHSASFDFLQREAAVPEALQRIGTELDVLADESKLRILEGGLLKAELTDKPLRDGWVADVRGGSHHLSANSGKVNLEQLKSAYVEARDEAVQQLTAGSIDPERSTRLMRGAIDDHGLGNWGHQIDPGLIQLVDTARLNLQRGAAIVDQRERMNKVDGFVREMKTARLSEPAERASNFSKVKEKVTGALGQGGDGNRLRGAVSDLRAVVRFKGESKAAQAAQRVAVLSKRVGRSAAARWLMPSKLALVRRAVLKMRSSLQQSA